jgi:Predicted NADH:ubiquinone oxidoreductase, subunit RnfE
VRRKELFRETSKIFLNGYFYRNPVLIAALGLYPVVAAGYNLRNAVELSLLFLLISLPTGLIACLIGQMVPNWARPGLVFAASAVCWLPAAWLTEHMIPGSITALGMFGGLMICNSAILSRANEYAPTHIGWAVAADSLGSSVGFFLVICICAIVRELWLKGSVWGANTGVYGTGESGVSLPFFGFVLVGFLAAFLQWVNGRRGKTSKRGTRV